MTKEEFYSRLDVIFERGVAKIEPVKEKKEIVNDFVSGVSPMLVPLYNSVCENLNILQVPKDYVEEKEMYQEIANSISKEGKVSMELMSTINQMICEVLDEEEN